jgi:hypothetical protein
MKRFAVATIAAILSACAGSLPSSLRTTTIAPDAVAPAACTTPKIDSGDKVTSITAFGDLGRHTFSLHQPSTWTTVQWLKVPPPTAHPIHRPSASVTYVQYWGTYTLSDKTQGCLYIVASSDTGDTTVTGSPRIPTKGATIPVDFGTVATLTFKLKKEGTGSGTVTLVHTDGSPAMTGTLTIMGTTNPK